MFMLSISKAFASHLTVEKKNIFRDRNRKKIYKIFELKIILLVFMPYNNE